MDNIEPPVVDVQCGAAVNLSVAQELLAPLPAEANYGLQSRRGGAAARLPDGRIFLVGGVSSLHYGSDDEFVEFAPPALLAPEYIVEHTFDNEVDDYRESGLFAWRSLKRGGNNHLSDNTEDAWCKVLDHSVTAICDLRVFIFGGRSDPHGAASCQRDVYVGRFIQTDELMTDDVAGREKMMPANVLFHKMEESNQPKRRPTSPPRGRRTETNKTNSSGTFALRHVFEGSSPSRRFGHSATTVGGGRVVLITGGRNERGDALSDMHYFLPTLAASDDQLVRTDATTGSRVLVEGTWLQTDRKRTGCPNSLCRLPQPSHHHQLIVSNATASHETWLLIADGKSLYRLDVRIHPPQVRPDGEVSEGDGDAPDRAMPPSPPPSAFALFEPLMPSWVQLLGGGVHASIPFRHSCLVVLLNADELLVHGGVRCIANRNGQQQAQRKVQHRSRHRAIAAIGEMSDTAFIYRFSTSSWSYASVLTEVLGYAATHTAVLLDDGRPVRTDGAVRFRRHLMVLGGGCIRRGDEGSTSTPVTLSSSGDGLEGVEGMPLPLMQILASRVCSAVVRRVGIAVGDIRMPPQSVVEPGGGGSSTVVDHAGGGAPLQCTLATTYASPRRLSCTAAGSPPRRHSMAHQSSQWSSPAIRIRDTLLQREAVEDADHLRQHLRSVLIAVLRESLGTVLIRDYFRLWQAFCASARATRAQFEELRRLDVASTVRVCTICHAVPVDIILQPCQHFVLCRACSEETRQCPRCGTVVERTTYGCSGAQFPYLHRFLTKALEAQEVVGATSPQKMETQSGGIDVDDDAEMAHNGSGRSTPPALRTPLPDGRSAKMFSSLVDLPPAVLDDGRDAGWTDDVGEHYYSPNRAKLAGHRNLHASGPPHVAVQSRRSLRVPRTMML